MRILLADDEARVRSALKLMLEQQPGLSVVGEVAEGASLVDEVLAIRPDAVLIDWELPGQPARELVAALRKAVPNLVVVALSGRPEARPAAMRAGASAFVSKGDPPEQVLATLGGQCVQDDRDGDG